MWTTARLRSLATWAVDRLAQVSVRDYTRTCRLRRQSGPSRELAQSGRIFSLKKAGRRRRQSNYRPRSRRRPNDSAKESKRISRSHQGPVMSLAPGQTVAQKNGAMMEDNESVREPSRSADVSSSTSDHIKTRSAHFKPDCDRSFDVNVIYKMMYVNETHQRAQYFEQL